MVSDRLGQMSQNRARNFPQSAQKDLSDVLALFTQNLELLFITQSPVARSEVSELGKSDFPSSETYASSPKDRLTFARY